MAKALGWLLFAAVSITLIINSVYMLFAPRAWLRLPAGSDRLERHPVKDNAGERGLIGIWMTGAVILAGIVWVVYDYFLRCQLQISQANP